MTETDNDTESDVQNFTSPSVTLAPTPPAPEADQALPTWDEAIKSHSESAKAQLPTWDEAMSKSQQEGASPGLWDTVKKTARAYAAAIPFEGSEAVSSVPFNGGENAKQDFYQNTAIGRIIDAFGHGMDEATGGYKDLGFSGETKEDLRKLGFFNDYANGQEGLLRGTLETILTPAAIELDAALRTGMIPFTAGGAALVQTAVETGHDEFGAMGEMLQHPEAFMGTGLHTPEFMPKRPVLPQLLAEARRDAVIGEGEAGYFGTKEPEPEDMAAREQAAVDIFSADIANRFAGFDQRIEEHLQRFNDAIEGLKAAGQTEAEKNENNAPDIHAIVRRIAPDTFNEYDRLEAERERHRDIMRNGEEIFGGKVDEEIARLKDEMPGLMRIPTGLTKEEEERAIRENGEKYTEISQRIKDLEKDRPDIIASMTEQSRQRMMDADYRMRALAPDVSAAYRQAQEFTPETSLIDTPAVPEAAAESADASPPEAGESPEIAPAADNATPTENAPTAESAPSAKKEEQRLSIADDVARQVREAGRPEQEAQALGALWEARYKTRAARFGGKLGTAEEMYREKGARIEAAKGGKAKTERPSAASAPLLPTKDKPEIGPNQPQNATGIESLDPREIGVDATRFQFKSGGDAQGITDRLQGVKEWNPMLANTAIVFRDAEGKNWVADGHQRIGLAQRLMAEGHAPIRVNAFVLNAADGFTDAGARIFTAAKNIAEGTGTAIDAAKIIREADESGIKLPALPPRSALARDGQALARLSPEAFGMAVNEVVPTQQAAIVGRLVDDPLEQSEAMRLLAQTKPENLRQAEMIVREMLETGTERMTQQNLFGKEAFASSVVLERAKIADRAATLLKRDTALFKTLVNEVERIEGAGENRLDKTTNAARLSTDEQAQEFLTQLATRKGPVSDALTGIAERLKSGELKPDAAAREFLGHVRRALDAGMERGDNAVSAESGSAGERKESGVSEQELARQEGQKELFQKVKGSAKLGSLNSGRGIIRLFKTADASTLIHESAHLWLDELVTDAAHDLAPDDLKADVAKVRKWLGDEEGPFSGFTRAQHERFVYGFKRYIMEGVAPSRELASVFARFRALLTNIYRRLTALKAPITDDIRDVFDRLLAEKPEKTVIAPEREPGRMLADIHEADAEAVAPHEARAVANDIEREQGAHLGERAAEDEHGDGGTGEVADDAGGTEAGAGGYASTGAQDGGASDAPESDGGTKSALPERGTVVSGGGEMSPEGDQSLPERAPAGTGGELGLQDGIDEKPLPRNTSRLIDKAGNIRLDNLNTPEDINTLLRATATQNGDFMDQRRGVISVDQQLALADALGMDAQTLNMRKIGQAFNAEQVIRARKLLIQSATDLKEKANQAASGIEADVAAYAEARARHIMIQGHVSGITAEAGRALGAFRKLMAGDGQAKFVGDMLKDATGKTLHQLQEEARLLSTYDSPEQVSRFVNDSLKPSFGEKVLEYWINGLLSGPATHTTYVLGNAKLSAWKALVETPIAALIGDTVKAGEATARLSAGARALPSALSATIKSLETGVTTLLPGEEAHAAPFERPDAMFLRKMTENRDVSWREVGSQTYGLFRGMIDAVKATDALVEGGEAERAPLMGLRRSPLGAIRDTEIGGRNLLPVGTAIRFPSRVVGAIHSFFRTLNYSMEKAALAYRAAAEEGLQGDAFKQRMSELTRNPSDEMMKQASKGATDLTLMGQGGEFTRTLSRLTNVSAKLPGVGETRLLKFIDPFVHISSNIVEQSLLQRTPIGLLSKEIRGDLMGVNGNAARDMARARMLAGTGLAILGGTLASQGYLSGSGPTDPREAAAWRMLGGNQPHSVRIGDTWYDIHRLGPLGMLLGVAADLHDLARSMDKQTLGDSATMLAHAFSQNILDESFMRGPSELMKAVEDSDRYGNRWLRGFASSFVPYSVGMGQITRATDPYARQARTVMDAIRAKLPWESQSLYPKRDIWGEPQLNRDALGGAGFSAIYESRLTQDAVNQAMLRLNMFPAQPERKVRDIELNDAQYDDLCRIGGRLAKMRLDALVRTSGFASQPPFSQRAAIKATIRASRETARSAVMMRAQEIIQQARANKQAMVSAPPKR